VTQMTSDAVSMLLHWTLHFFSSFFCVTVLFLFSWKCNVSDIDLADSVTLVEQTSVEYWKQIEKCTQCRGSSYFVISQQFGCVFSIHSLQAYFFEL